VKPVVELVLPLLDQTAGANDQTALDNASYHQLLDKQPCHDGFPGAWIVGQKKPERLPREHFAVDGGDLVWQGLDKGCVDRQERVK